MIKLPIDNLREEIITAVDSYDVVVISAETGAGKSTRVPEFLAETGYSVVVTEPRRVAAVTLAERVSEELNLMLGTYAGFATGFEKNYSDDTKILFATDGLQLVRELNQRNNFAKRVLILDEIHEMNLNMETLIAWCKKQIEEEKFSSKLVIMSATLNSEEMINYFGEERTKVISVPGSLYEVSFEEKKEHELSNEIRKAISLNENTLVFLPGKREIEDLMEDLKCEEATILPLHGELSYTEQKKCFISYDIPKVILATNVAQTSITVPDIDCVIDTGLERRIEREDGIEGLFLRNCSQKDILQRKGRAGRTHEGRYVLCSNTEFRFRSEFASPEIYRLSLEQVVLKLASVSIDATDVRFLHQPSFSSLQESKNLLIDLGALTKDGKLTDIGKEMSKMPVSARISRMLVEARKYRYMKPAIVIASILENGSLKARGVSSYEHSAFENFSSDLMYEYFEYIFVRENAPIDFKKEGINSKTYFRVLEYVKKLNTLYLDELFDVEIDENIIIRIIFSGMRDLLFFRGYGDKYHDIENNVEGLIDRNSSCYYTSKTIIGFPHKIEFTSKWGIKESILLISLCSKIDPDLLVELDKENSKKELGRAEVVTVDYMGEYIVRRDVRYYYKGYNFLSTYEDIEDDELREKAIAEYEEQLRKEKEEREKNAEQRRKEYDEFLRREHEESYIVFGAKEYYVNDRSSSHPTILLYKEDLEKKLPNEAWYKGKTRLHFVCEGREATSIENLRMQVGLKLLKEKLNKEASKKERVDLSSNLLEILKTSGEVKVSISFAGETYEDTLYKYLEMEGKNIFVKTSLTKVDVSSKVKEFLQTLFKKEAEKKYQENIFFFVIKGERTLTNKGAKAYGKYRDEKIMVLDSLTVDNYEDSMEYLGIIYEEAREMLG